MVEYLRLHQLNIMVLLCGSCIILALLLMNTRFLARGRKAILILMEVTAFLLLWFDRLAYIYAGDVSHKGYIMVRLSNFMVFFLTSAIVFGFNLYLSDLLIQSKACEVLPRRLYIAGALSAVGMLMAVIAAFSGLYYYFDETNRYHRAPGFLIAYIIPVLCPLMQY
ncbi:MAG: diguanylate cyclase, partial [Lachnospiraceae bacterium]|nr:diguanylate cyclase [Lachnospiraceae bacterium]